MLTLIQHPRLAKDFDPQQRQDWHHRCSLIWLMLSSAYNVHHVVSQTFQFGQHSVTFDLLLSVHYKFTN